MRTIVASTAFLALLVGSAVAQQPAAAPGQVCIKAPSGALKCEYQTMAQCEAARPAGSSDPCVTRSSPDSTVGGQAPSERRQPAPAPGDQKD